MDIVLDPKNNIFKNFAFIAKFKMAAGGQIPKSTKFDPTITFRLGIWISFIRFGQNLAWTYFLTLLTSLSKNLSVSAKSKMAARGQMSKINLWGQIWSILDLWPPAAILDFALTDKFVLKLVIGVKKYVHAIFCPNLMKEIHMPSQNVISGVKFGRFWTFDPRQPSLILR